MSAATIATLGHNAFRECQRRSFPYIAAAVITLLTFASQLFQAFSFGAGKLEAANLAISAVFLAGLIHAAFLATQLIRVDLERGTLGLQLAQPVGLPAYVLGRFLGAAASGLLLCGIVAALVCAAFLLPFAGVPDEVYGPSLYAGFLRALLPVLILEAAALAASAVASRLFAPVLLFALFLGGSVAGGSVAGLLLPDFSLFGLEAGPGPSWAWMMLYTLVYSGVFLVTTYGALLSRAPLRSQG